MEWEQLIAAAEHCRGRRELSPFVEAGTVSAAILTRTGHLYTGVCIDTACSLGMCAERNAIGSMITAGESEITKLVCCMEDGALGLPCGACRELLMQINDRNGEMEILTNRISSETVRLYELLPGRWGKERTK